MNRIKLVFEVVDGIIAIAKLIRDAAELRKKEIDVEGGFSESQESENSKES